MAAYDPYPGLVRLWKELECRNLGNTVSPCRKRKKERGKEERKEDWTGEREVEGTLVIQLSGFSSLRWPLA